MKRTVLAAAVAICGWASAWSQQADLSALQSQYTDGVLSIDVTAAKSEAALLAAYTNDIHALRGKVQRAGNLEALKAAIAEIARVQSEHNIPSNRPAVPEMEKLVTAYQERSRRLQVGRAQEITALAAKYDKALELLARRLTQNGDIDGATEVQNRRNLLPATEPLAGAKKLLASSDAARESEDSGAGSGGAKESAVIPLQPAEASLAVGEEKRWSFTPPRKGAVLLSLEARVNWKTMAGYLSGMELSVNSQPVTGKMLVNKELAFTMGDGRSDLYTGTGTAAKAGRWIVFYSPDFEANNGPGNGYQVRQGQAYLYVFDITPLVKRGFSNTIALRNCDEAAHKALNRPIPLAFRDVKLLPGPSGRR